MKRVLTTYRVGSIHAVRLWDPKLENQENRATTISQSEESANRLNMYSVYGNINKQIYTVVKAFIMLFEMYV